MKKLPLFLIIPAVFTLSCRLKVPIKEMMDARYGIQRAHEVKGEKYAPTLLDDAIRHLFRAHNLLEKEDEKKSKEEAIKSLELANKAIEKSLPPLAKDTLYTAE